ncbi:hypothetical protein NQ318_005258 [Aromia moschata]|uniref:MD-2-related lipid-recognition domain-containing protein n=1 Tax=Aromia moschata TaxID=1265417 RepID=A0AAV8Y2D5_9CUCU|nr:hypothetical protein NQ318_005258 [Aromia moschata]
MQKISSQATIEVKKDELGMWIKVPCVDQMGSCTYDDLCAHGVPVGNSCPRQFIDSKVPCRCPIPKGTYTIKPSVELPMSSYALSSVYAGKYWAKATFVDKEINLACYNVYFNIIDKVVEDEKEYGQIYYNNIDPFVELVR